jgi:hypothetical protein
MDEGSIDLFVKPSYSSNKARAATDWKTISYHATDWKVQFYLQWFDSHSERNFAASLQPLQIDDGQNYDSGDGGGDVKKLTSTRVEDTEFGPSLQRTSKYYVLPPVLYYKSFRTATRSPKHNFDFSFL